MATTSVRDESQRNDSFQGCNRAAQKTLKLKLTFIFPSSGVPLAQSGPTFRENAKSTVCQRREARTDKFTSTSH